VLEKTFTVFQNPALNEMAFFAIMQLFSYLELIIPQSHVLIIMTIP